MLVGKALGRRCSPLKAMHLQASSCTRRYALEVVVRPRLSATTAMEQGDGTNTQARESTQ